MRMTDRNDRIQNNYSISLRAKQLYDVPIGEEAKHRKRIAKLKGTHSIFMSRVFRFFVVVYVLFS